MPEYDNTNRGVLFKNSTKKSDKHPDYSGSINVGGVDHFLDAWIKEGQKGKFMSLSIKQKGQPAQRPAAKSTKPAVVDDDSIPF
jgi:hypothetical protein